jgi:hypothetical protein
MRRPRHRLAVFHEPRVQRATAQEHLDGLLIDTPIQRFRCVCNIIITVFLRLSFDPMVFMRDNYRQPGKY